MAGFSLNDLNELCERTQKLGDALCRLLAGYRIGDQVRVTQFKGLDRVPDEDRENLAGIIGKVFEIKDIDFWETTDESRPYHVSYRLEIGDCTDAGCAGCETVYMDEDEIEPATPPSVSPSNDA